MLSPITNMLSHIITSHTYSLERTSLQMRSVSQNNEITSPSPTPQLDIRPMEQETTVTRLVVIGALILAGIALLVIILVLLVIGILIVKRSRKKSIAPNAILHEEFETHYERGM